MRRSTALLVGIAACTPDLVDDTSLVTVPRILAVRADPAESPPGTAVAFRALWAGPGGTAADAPLDWAFCTARKPFTEPGAVNPGCLAATSPDLVPFGTGVAAGGTLPVDGCRRFGPDRPDPVPGEPAARPTDPDGTGGYYQPLRVYAAGGEPDFALGQPRIRCGLPMATPMQATEYQRTYQDNLNPAIAAVEISRAGTAVALTSLETDPDASTSVSPGEVVQLVVRWNGAESYPWFDPEAHELVTRRESVRISWFATEGAFATGHTGRAEREADNASSDNVWTAPQTGGDVVVWIVVRDDRGGTAWASFRVTTSK
jgi:hypothetical protein